MISIVHPGQLLVTLFDWDVVCFGQLLYALAEVFLEIFFGDTADIRIAGIHWDVLEIIEATENAEFTNLGDTGKEAKLDIGILCLHHTVETLKLLAEGVGQRIIPKVVYDRLIVFVNQDDNGLSGFGISSLNQGIKTYTRYRFITYGRVTLFVVL